MCTYSNGLPAWRAYGMLYKYTETWGDLCHPGFGLSYLNIQKNNSNQKNIYSYFLYLLYYIHA